MRLVSAEETEEEEVQATSKVTLSWEFLDGAEDEVVGVNVYALQRRRSDDEESENEVKIDEMFDMQLTLVKDENGSFGRSSKDHDFILNDEVVSVTSIHVGNAVRTLATMKNLLPNTEYTFFVLPYIGNEDGTPSNSIDVKLAQIGK